MHRLVSLTVSVGLAAMLFVVARPAAASPGWDLILKQDAPVIVAQDSQDGAIVTRVFEAVVRNRAGKRVGTLSGQQESLESTLEGKVEETRLRTLVFVFKGGQIIAQGASDYPVDGGKFRPGKAFTIAIIGGTGTYVGARGELMSILNADGSYTQKFRFVD